MAKRRNVEKKYYKFESGRKFILFPVRSHFTSMHSPCLSRSKNTHPFIAIQFNSISNVHAICVLVFSIRSAQFISYFIKCSLKIVYLSFGIFCAAARHLHYYYDFLDLFICCRTCARYIWMIFPSSIFHSKRALTRERGILPSRPNILSISSPVSVTKLANARMAFN